ncbi:MAG TPA: portal protein, partial [Candidatus Limnocylindrales bacterium]|nr:portal protein [Candidatus Limnocylindrales bacterium]
MADTDDGALKELRERFEYAHNEWQPIREEGAKDMRYIAGDPWDPKDRRAREEAKRPVLSLDELGQYVNQLVNDVRASKRAIRITATGNGANDALANARANLIRQIEYKSHAQMAYTTAFENAVQRGYGFLRVSATYAQRTVDKPTARSFDQELRIDPIVNPDLVTPDPDALRPDMSDQRYAFVREAWLHEDFKRNPLFRGATIKNFSGNNVFSEAGPLWLNDKKVWVAEAWAIESKPRTLVLLPHPTHPKDGEPQAVWRDTMTDADWRAEKGRVIREREVDAPYVCQKLTNGLEIFKTVDWPGEYIPIVACLGKVIWVDEGNGPKRKVLSLIRLARDPYMLYCYYRSCEAELVGMTPKFPYFAYEGQLTPAQLKNLQKSLHEPVAVVTVKPTVEGVPAGTVLSFPARQPYEPPIAGLEVGAEAARRAIQSAMGSGFLPTQAQRRNEKSGVALRQIETSAQKGSYHFIDHYEDALRHCGVVLNDLIPHYYDTARDIHVRKPDDTPIQLRINDPNTVDEESQQPIILTEGDYDVTISTGPSFESEREQASTFADTLIGARPEVFALIGDLVIKLKNLGPIGDEMAKRLETMLPAPVKQAKDGGQVLPPQVQQQLAQAQQMVEAAMAKVQELQRIIDTDAVKGERDVQLAQLKAHLELGLQQLKGEQALEQLR